MYDINKINIVLNYTVHFVYSPLNSYAYIHWICDFKYILLLLLLSQAEDHVHCDPLGTKAALRLWHHLMWLESMFS